MFYRKNMGSKESWARVIGGALIDRRCIFWQEQ